MISFGWLRVAVLAALFAAASFVPAAAAKAPSGSYLDTCSRASASRDVLRAYCERGHRRYKWATIERYSACIGDIGNYYGELICLRRRDMPRGNWSDSCINPHLWAPGVFAAVCKSLRGGWIASHIDLDKCRLGITNAKGTLACMKAEAKEEPPQVPPTPTQKPRDQAPSAPSAPSAPIADEGSPPQPSQPLPAGSYQRTCRSLDFDGRYLGGECRDKRNAWQDTSLDTKSCARDQEIGNNNGELVCTRSTEGRTPPAGRYQKTCRNISFDGRFVRAECQDSRGPFIAAVLDTRTCKDGDDILNEDGEILCRRPAPPPAPPVPPAPPGAPGTPPPSATPHASTGVTTTVPAPQASVTTTTPAAAPAPPAAPIASPPATAPSNTPVATAQPAPPAPVSPATATSAPVASASPTTAPAVATPPPTSAPPAVKPPAAPAPVPAPAPFPPPTATDSGNHGAAVSPPTGHDPATGGASSSPIVQSITLYEKKDFSGASRTFSGGAPDLAPFGWNDLASSLQVRGAWEVCEEPNYGGRCERVGEDTSDLGDLKLNKRISSFRPAKATKP